MLQLTCDLVSNHVNAQVFVPESGNTYERAALDKFWLTSSAAGAPPRDPLNNTVLTTKQVYTNWDKRREVHAWLQDHPNYVPKGWVSAACLFEFQKISRLFRILLMCKCVKLQLSHDDMPSANAHTNVPNYPHAGIHHRHMHVELNLNLNLRCSMYCLYKLKRMSLQTRGLITQRAPQRAPARHLLRRRHRAHPWQRHPRTRARFIAVVGRKLGGHPVLFL